MSKADDNLSIRILVVDDHDLIRGMIRRFLSDASNFHVVGEASGGEDAVRMVIKNNPDVILLDLSVARMDGWQALRTLCKATIPKPNILILTVDSDERNIMSAMMLGANGYMLKPPSLPELFKAIKIVSSGHRYICEELRDKIQDQDYSSFTQ